eukprot:SAG22_NODE_2913_length_2109_cov_1.533333_1_plen_197_part_00
MAEGQRWPRRRWLADPAARCQRCAAVAGAHTPDRGGRRAAGPQGRAAQGRFGGRQQYGPAGDLSLGRLAEPARPAIGDGYAGPDALGQARCAAVTESEGAHRSSHGFFLNIADAAVALLEWAAAADRHLVRVADRARAPASRPAPACLHICPSRAHERAHTHTHTPRTHIHTNTQISAVDLVIPRGRRDRLLHQHL